MEMTFDYQGLLKGKDEAGLKELIAAADRDNATCRLLTARNDLLKAMCQHRIIAMQLQEDAE